MLPRFRADFIAKIQHAMYSEGAIVAIPAYTDRATVIQLSTHSMRHALSDSIFHVDSLNGNVIMASSTWVSGWAIDTITGTYT